MTITNSFNPEGGAGPTSYSMNPDITPQQVPVQINLNVMDLQQILASVELAVQRGAYKASELSTIGASFDKVFGFINQVSQMNAVPQQQTTPEPVAPMTPPFSPRGA